MTTLPPNSEFSDLVYNTIDEIYLVCDNTFILVWRQRIRS